MAAVEVTARFGGTLILAERVEPGSELRIGTAPDVHLAVAGLGRFPLVGADGQILIPAGAVAAYVADGARVPVADRSVRLGPGARLELVLGQVALAIEHAAAVAPLARPRGERELLPYVATMLGAHLVLVAAMLCADPPKAPAPKLSALRAARLAKAMPHTALTQPLPPPETLARALHLERARKPLPPAAPSAEQHAAAPLPPAGPLGTQQAIARERSTGEEHAHAGGLAGAIAALWGPDWATATQGWDPLYREGDGDAAQFGGRGQRFDPTTDPRFASVPSGPYATVAHGAAAGDDYALPGETRGTRRDGAIGSDLGEQAVSGAAEVELCTGHGCTAQGAIDRAAVTSWIEPHAADLRACIERDPGPAGGSITVAFTIDGGGVARSVRARASGKVGGCVAAVVASIAFPRTEHATTVTYPISFRRSAS